MPASLKIALIHDDFVQEGGAENLFAIIASIWPETPVYTSLVDWTKLPKSVGRDRIRTSFIQKIPFVAKFYKLLLPLYPLVFESFNFDGFDLVISSTTRFAKSVITKPETVHICYTNNVPRFLWDLEVQKNYLPQFLIKILNPYFSWLKRWDKTASSRVDFFIANSQNVQGRIKNNYSASSQIIYPSADVDFYTVAKVHNWELKSKNYFLVVTRLVGWKKIEIAVEAVAELDSHLIIAGDGPDKSRLKKIARRKKSNVKFEGKVAKERLKVLYQNAKALLVTQEEDFGISIVEAQASGIPVIAYKKGGQAEIVIGQKTGLFFEEQTTESLKDAIEYSSRIKWSETACRKNALRFSKESFIWDLKAYIEEHAKKTIGV